MLVKQPAVAIDVPLNAELLCVGQRWQPHLTFLLAGARNTPISNLHYGSTHVHMYTCIQMELSNTAFTPFVLLFFLKNVVPTIGWQWILLLVTLFNLEFALCLYDNITKLLQICLLHINNVNIPFDHIYDMVTVNSSSCTTTSLRWFEFYDISIILLEVPISSLILVDGLFMPKFDTIIPTSCWQNLVCQCGLQP